MNRFTVLIPLGDLGFTRVPRSSKLGRAWLSGDTGEFDAVVTAYRDELERRALMHDHKLQVAVIVAAAERAGRTYRVLSVQP